MSKDFIKVALFGAGKMGLHHVRAINLQNHAKLVAIADPCFEDVDAVNPIAKDVSIFKSAEELLQTVKPDVVHICTPPNTHAAMAILALRHNAHVYVEKPFALRLQDAKDVISLSNKLGLKVCAGHQLLFESPGVKARESVGKLGRIVHVESYFSFRTVRRSPYGRALMSASEQLLDILPHPTYLLLHFLRMSSSKDEPVEIVSLKITEDGNVHGIITCGKTTGLIVVTLEGRPIENYVRVVGTNGSLNADFVRGKVTILPGPGTSGISKAFNPYDQAWQDSFGTTSGLLTRVFRKQKSYPGLCEIIGNFYGCISRGAQSPIDSNSILDTVRICEIVSNELKAAENSSERLAREKLIRTEEKLPPVNRERGWILVTGGTGLLGRALVPKLRENGWPVRIITRRMPTPSDQIPGVAYELADLGESVPIEILNGVATIIHCAAETFGGVEAHKRNTILATRNIIEAAAKAKVDRFIHISSIAVLKPSSIFGNPLDENSPIDLNNLERGPYVWGKAESESLASQLCADLGIDLRIIRLGPLIDFNNFEAPGRLGREVGPFFIAMGNKKSKINMCQVQTAAKVILSYISDFNDQPVVLNLIEPESPKRIELVTLLLKKRPDLHIFWITSIVLTMMSPFLNILQRIIRPDRKPIDFRAAFSSEKYKSERAARIIQLID
jgi:predicted dehydrogenase/nucleoside-diphosphate-sugar epimerase